MATRFHFLTKLNLLTGVKGPLRVGLVVGFITALISLFLPNEYKSEARILPADVKSIGGGASSLAAAAGVAMPGQESPDAGYVDILNSRSIREALIRTKFRFSVRS